MIRAAQEYEEERRKTQLHDIAFILSNVCGALGAKSKCGSALTTDDFLPEELRSKPKATLGDLFCYLKSKAIAKTENN